MAQGFSRQKTIHAPVDEVWDRLTDWPNAPVWMNGISDMDVEGASAEGAAITFTARGKQRTSTIMQWEPPKVVTLRSTQGKVRADYRYTLAPVGEATEVTLDARCGATGVMAYLTRFIAKGMERADGGQLDALAETFA